MISTQTLSVSNGCNLACTYCWYETGAAEYPHAALTLDDYADWFRRCAEKEPLTRLILTGGEPMLREDLPELLRIGHSYFPEVLLLTNGLLLTRRPDFVGELSRMGTRVHVSLDHVSPSIDDRVRGGTKGALVGLNALAAAHVETQVTLVLTAKNYSDLPYVIGYCRQHDFDLEVNPVAVPPTHPQSLTTLGGAERDLLVAELRAAKQMLGRPEYYFRVIRYLQGSPIRPLTACRAVEAGVFIEADGNIQALRSAP